MNMKLIPIFLRFILPAPPVWITALALALAAAWPATGRAQSGAEDPTYNRPQLGGPVFAISLDPVTGKAVVGGIFSSYFNPESNVARVNTDGHLDLTFAATLGSPASGTLEVNAVAVQPDGKVIAGGNFTVSDAVPHQDIVRLLGNGQPDVAFNVNLGSGVDSDGGTVFVVALQSDGKILVGGDFRSFNGAPARGLIRLNTDLTRDLSFVPDETVVVDAGFIRALIVQPDGGILILNQASVPYRLTASGALDTSFDASGVKDATGGGDFNTSKNFMALQDDGKVLTDMTFTTSTNGGPPYTFTDSIVRLNSDGTLDSSFDFSPKISTGATDSVPDVRAILAQPDGSVVFAGVNFTTVSGSPHKSVVRLDPNGLLDDSFNVTLFSGTLLDSASALALQSDGRLLVGANFPPLLRLFDLGAPAPGIALNISTRLNVQIGDNVLIGGFIITGTDPKEVIVRGIGPSLGAAGVPDFLADPVLELHKSDGTIITNNNWKDTQQTEITATGFAPSSDLESAILATLDPGIYTAILRGNNDGSGVGLVEAYDLDQAADSTLANISTRGLVETGDNVMIGGFIVGGGSGGVSTVVLRAIGPSLSGAGVSNALQNPSLELHDSEGVTIAVNDDWLDGPDQQTISDDGLAPTNNAESALLAILPPGAYTAIVSGVGDTTGVGLVEVYNLLP
jgi:uncharacterized delta-60 repeat protein